MARMIPTNISPEIKSNAERKIFEWFKQAPDTEDWVVLHSLGISNHRTVIYGEIDFVVLAPKLGVFALEVKGGRIKRENGYWVFQNKYGATTKKKRGPFEQAKEGVFSLFDYIEKKKGKDHRLSKLIFGYGVMMPDISFQVSDPEIETWQIFDENNGNDVKSFVISLATHVKKKWQDIYHFWDSSKVPDNKTIKELTEILRGDFEMVTTTGNLLKEAEENLIKLTLEQIKCLDQIEDNPRCLITGAAGTGKTLLAIEDVKRSVLMGERVAFFCYNNNLSEWLRKYFSMLDVNLQPNYVGSFHSFLFNYAKPEREYIDHLNEYEKNKFYSEELPLRAAIAIEERGISFDKIVIDEGQDLITEDYIDLLDILLKGDIERGKWSIYGDFQMQAIYGEKNPAYMKKILEDKTQFIKYKLIVNCRNTKPIGDEIKYISGVDTEQYVWMNLDGPPVNYYTYDDEIAELKILKDLLKMLKKENIKGCNITILSPFKRENSVVSSIPFSVVQDFKPGENEDVSFSTIGAFKGLENSVIILVDIDTYSHEKMMYVGLSRARTGLYILQTSNADKERRDLLKRWYRNG